MDSGTVGLNLSIPDNDQDSESAGCQDPGEMGWGELNEGTECEICFGTLACLKGQKKSN